MAKAEGQPYEAVFVEKQFFEVAQISDGWRKRGEDVVTVWVFKNLNLFSGMYLWYV